MLTFLLISYHILFAILAYRRSDWAIYLIVLALPSYLIRFQVFGIPATLLEGMTIILAFVWLLRNSKLRILNSKFPKNFFWPVGLFLLAATVGVFMSPDLRAAAGVWKAYFLEPVLFFIVFINVIKSKDQIRKVLWALGYSVLVPGLLAIYQKFTGVFIPNEFWADAATRRVTSVYGYPNAIGLYFAPVITLLVGRLVIKLKSIFNRQAELVSTSGQTLKPIQGDNKKWLELVLIGLLITISTLSIIFAQSKGAILAVAVGILFYALFWQGNRKYFITILIASVLSLFIFYPNLISLEGSKTVAGGGSMEVRIQQWDEAWQMLQTKPLFGAGLSGYQTAVAPFHEKDYIEIFMYPHQIFLNFWTEIGLLGLIAFTWLVVIFFRKGSSGLSFQAKQSVVEVSHHSSQHDEIPRSTLSGTMLKLSVMAAMTSLLAHGLLDVPYFKNDLSLLFWILFGLIIISDRLNLNKV